MFSHKRPKNSFSTTHFRKFKLSIFFCYFSHLFVQILIDKLLGLLFFISICYLSFKNNMLKKWKFGPISQNQDFR